jgi:hypothetical protein
MMRDAETELEKLTSELGSANGRLKGFRVSGTVVGEGGEDAATKVVFRRLLDKIGKEELLIEGIKGKINDAEGRISAFEEAIKLFPKPGEDGDLRAGSQMAEVRDALQTHGKPMALADILKAIGHEGDDKKRNSLRGSLASYAREGRVFTKEDGSDTFGLLEFKSENGENGSK